MLAKLSRTNIIGSVLLFVACSDDDPGPTLPNTIGNSSSDSAGSTAAEETTGDPEGTSGPTEETTGDPEGTSGPWDPTTGGEPSPDVPVCNPEDDLEPNDVEDGAWVLPNITDEDNSGSLVDSILAGQYDIDWFAYKGSDVAFAYVDPAVALDTEMQLRLCLYVECDTGFTPVPDCINSVYDESPNGYGGCCNTGESAFVSIDLTCPDGGGDDSAFVFMRVDRGHGDTCVPYDLEYHF